MRRLIAALGAALALSCGGTAAAETPPDVSAQSRALQRASDAVVGIVVQAVDDARTARTLGRQRAGSGVVIGSDGLVLTIGYLVLEAEQVLLLLDDGRRIPARPVGYDVATGFGLVQALAPLAIEPAPLGDPALLTTGQPLMVASGGDDGAVSVAELVARRPFSGYLEYHIEGALFTAPPRRDHSGAGLFNERGELVGIGSLVLADTAGADAPRRPGNMFVPVDLLRPILAELRERGTSAASTRAWMGVNCIEADGEVRVARVAEDSPADVAGLERGDRIVAIDGQPVNGLEQLWKRLWSGGAAEREVRLDIERAGERQAVRLVTVDRAKTLRRAQGV